MQTTNQLAFEDTISFVPFPFIIEVQIPFYEVVHAGFRKATMKSKLVFDMSEERFQRIGCSWQSWVVNILKQIGYSPSEVYICLPEVIADEICLTGVVYYTFFTGVLRIVFGHLRYMLNQYNLSFVLLTSLSFITRFLSSLASGDLGWSVMLFRHSLWT